MKKWFILLLLLFTISLCPDISVNAYMIDNICPNPFAERTKVTIRFMTNGGKPIKELNYCSNCGSGSFDLPIPVREGYTFDGWYADIALTKKVNNNFIKNIDGQNITIIPDKAGCNVNSGYTYLYAKWEQSSDSDIIINFNTGISDKIDSLKICSTCSKSNISLPVLSKEGYVFLGWYKEAELINKVDIKNNKSEDIYEKLVLETKVDDNNIKYRYATLYAGWVEENEVKYLIVDEVDKNISIINDLMNR